MNYLKRFILYFFIASCVGCASYLDKDHGMLTLSGDTIPSRFQFRIFNKRERVIYIIDKNGDYYYGDGTVDDFIRPEKVELNNPVDYDELVWLASIAAKNHHRFVNEKIDYLDYKTYVFNFGKANNIIVKVLTPPDQDPPDEIKDLIDKLESLRKQP